VTEDFADLLRQGTQRLRNIFVRAVYFGTSRLVGEDDGSGNIDPFWYRRDGTSTNLSDAVGGGGAPNDADFLVGTADGDLTNEIVVGASPGGELGGSWGTPTVDGTHSGSAHHAQAHGPSQHTSFANWKVIYTDGSGDQQELALGADGEVLTSTGTAGAPAFEAGGGAGDNDLTTIPGSDHTVSGLTATFVANEDQAIGDACYMFLDAGDPKMKIGDASLIGTSNVIAMCADATISADASGSYLLFGFIRDDTWSWTIGGLIYLTITGTKGNTLSQTAPSGTDEVVQIVGVATHADRMLFKPALVQVEHT
jgi:hypothetical protein